MVKQFLWCFLCFASTTLAGQNYSLTVINGYGSGIYPAGDTVHIWSAADHGRDYFDTWSGDTNLVDDPLNWHTTLMMPAYDVTIEAVIDSLPDEVVFSTTAIKGADTLKEIWYAFPDPATMQGLVWLFHGTDGTGKNWFINNDMLVCTKKLLAEGYAVVSLDCEEKTYDMDFNADGVYRWDYSFDSTQNIDLRNVKAIRDTFLAHGFIDSATPQIAYGYSAGGAFATHIATLLQWRAGIAHNSAGVPWVPTFGLTPILYSMTANDNHPDVGLPGNMAAEANALELQSRGICAEFHLTLPQPLYPQRFSRDTTISLSLSTSIFNELQNNHALDDKNYLLYTSDQLTGIIFSNPGDWQVILGLTPAQRLFVSDEIDESFATHRFNSDLFGSDFRFITGLCEEPNATGEAQFEPIVLYPNPASDFLIVQEAQPPYIIYNGNGQRILQTTDAQIDVSAFPTGLYLIVCRNKAARFIKV